ncbi:helix-turn-helix domain-containing protein [Methylocystis suflitae]|uniref:helix-turn-helix domain-containing protein n=1 Tax=Methylocystis suflitae TaxID=2951405 RepID=UPI00210B620A|nr:helix-turn-helix domain-containing protein [Methylocystis suflitae]MCQ4189008.1 helix-turn-helix domain-containing protein [Methylocystis suflitae]
MSAIFRKSNGITVYQEGERRERGEITLDEAAEILNVSRATAYRLITSGVLPAQQLCSGAPLIIRLDDVQEDNVRNEADARR